MSPAARPMKRRGSGWRISSPAGPPAALGAVTPSYKPGVHLTDLAQCLPDFVVAALREALPVFGRQIANYDHPDAMMTGVETRTSSPVRITRGRGSQSLNTAGLYPAGERRGYAGRHPLGGGGRDRRWPRRWRSASPPSLPRGSAAPPRSAIRGSVGSGHAPAMLGRHEPIGIAPRRDPPERAHQPPSAQIPCAKKGVSIAMPCPPIAAWPSFACRIHADAGADRALGTAMPASRSHQGHQGSCGLISGNCAGRTAPAVLHGAPERPGCTSA